MCQESKKGKPEKMNSGSTWDWMRNHSAAIQAISTVVLVCVTIATILYTRSQVKIQEKQLVKQGEVLGIQRQQFELVNRAKINPKFGEQVVGGIDGGKLVLTNIGNLPARDFRLIWKIVKLSGDKVTEIYPEINSENKILSLDRIEGFSKKNVSPEEIIIVPYKSEFDTRDNTILMVLAWKYKGLGIEGNMIKDRSFLWNTYVTPPTWALTSRLGYPHIRADIAIRDKLRQFLENEN